MESPLHHTGSVTWAPSGIAYDEGSRMRDVLVEEDRLYTITNNTDGRGDPSEDDDRLLELEME